MADHLWAWPDGGRRETPIPKEAIVAQTPRGKTAVRDLLKSEVAGIRWLRTLTPAVLGVQEAEGLPEIQVIEVTAKGDDTSSAALDAIDSAIATPVVFEVRSAADARRVRFAASLQYSGAALRTAVFTTGWVAGDRRTPLPAAVDLRGFYAALLAPILPVSSRPEEGLAALASRVTEAVLLGREIERTETRMRNEKQFKKKVELRRSLKTIEAQLEEVRA